VRPYHELAGLEHLYLEDSYVLAIDEAGGELRFELDAVLTESHPSWAPPKPHEQYAYARLALVFPGLREITWRSRTMRPSTDAAGEIDYGNIDTLTAHGSRYELTGDWGEVVIESDPPTVVEP
jgi:hypothetical protein